MARRFAVLVTLLAACVGVAREPEPLLKPAVVPSGFTRVKVPLVGGDDATLMRGRGFVYKAKSTAKKADDLIPITVGFDTSGGKGFVTVGTLKKWGYDATVGQKFVLPELLLVGEVAAKGKAGTEVRPRVVKLACDVIDPPPTPNGGDAIYGADIMVGTWDVLRAPDRQAEPRLYIGGKYFEASYPAASLVRPPAGSKPPAPPPADDPPAADKPPADEPEPVGFVAGLPLSPFRPTFDAALNGKRTVSLGETKPVAVVFSAGTVTVPGVMVSRGMAEALKLDVNIAGGNANVVTLDSKAAAAITPLKELRIAAQTGPGFKIARELVFANEPVLAVQSESEPLVYVGPEFVNRHFRDAVFAVGPDGVPKLYGRAKADAVQEPMRR